MLGAGIDVPPSRLILGIEHARSNPDYVAAVNRTLNLAGSTSGSHADLSIFEFSLPLEESWCAYCP